MAKSSERAIESRPVPSDVESLMIELEEQTAIIPTREQIEQRAYELYLGRGCAEGLDVQDWLQAESELLAEAENNSPRAKAAAV
ncbi:MAG TPA: DUF2934 domain-containing protein [Candidatus Acidoferrales bacterium]|nr:DUF2934 domain-containing protein [Candidatus Acidoferrales bacterium]